REWSGGLTQGVLAIAFDDNLSQCARLNEDGTVTVCRVGDETVVARWKVAGARILSGTERPAKFSRDGRYLAVWYGHPGFLEVRRLDGQEAPVCFRAEDCSGGDADFTPDNTTLAYLVTDTRIALADLRSGQVRYLMPTGVE